MFFHNMLCFSFGFYVFAMRSRIFFRWHVRDLLPGMQLENGGWDWRHVAAACAAEEPDHGVAGKVCVDFTSPAARNRFSPAAEGRAIPRRCGCRLCSGSRMWTPDETIGLQWKGVRFKRPEMDRRHRPLRLPESSCTIRRKCSPRSS